jgi:chromosome condensin MukBEF MukE localization factor
MSSQFNLQAMMQAGNDDSSKLHEKVRAAMAEIRIGMAMFGDEDPELMAVLQSHMQTLQTILLP